MAKSAPKTAPAAASTPAPAAPAPAAPAKAEKPVATKAKVEKVEKVAAKPAAVETPAATTAETPVVESSALSDFEDKMVAVEAVLKQMKSAFKVLSKEYEKMKKVLAKNEKKRANARTNPNGFAKPTKITNELCDFLGVAHGTEKSRTEVTREINAYIKKHNLNKPDNKRIILPDTKLRALLNVKAGDEVSFFSLQKFLSPLFIKKTA